MFSLTSQEHPGLSLATLKHVKGRHLGPVGTRGEENAVVMVIVMAMVVDAGNHSSSAIDVAHVFKPCCLPIRWNPLLNLQAEKKLIALSQGQICCQEIPILSKLVE